MIVVNFIAFILVIGVIILVHELGHFITAKKAGVKCSEFSIGMGPIIKQWQKDETTISLRWIPLGGYVQMVDGNESDLYIDLDKELGINLDESGNVKEIILDNRISADVVGICKRKELKSIHGEDLELDLEVDGVINTYSVLSNASYVFSKSERMELVPYERSFDSKKIWQRLIILFAGALMNFILGLVLCIIASFWRGVPNYDSNVVGNVEESYPAFKMAGLQKGDEIEGFIYNGKTYEIKTWNDISNKLGQIYKEDSYPAFNIVYKRNGEVNTSSLVRPYVYIYNTGITSANAENYENKSSVEGVVVGKVAIEYDSDGDKIHEGDIITEIRVDKWDANKKNYVESSFEAVSNWNDIVDKLSSVDAAQVYFKFLSRSEENGVVTYSDVKTTKSITTYSEEVLRAQNVVKVQYLLGIEPAYHIDFKGCLSNALAECGSYFSLVVRTLKVLIAPSNGARTIGLNNMSSVVGIFGMVKNALSAGPQAFLFFVAMLSINIGIMNLLPIPALDGGRIVFVLYEAITRRKPNKKFETYLTLIVYVLLIILFIYITSNDIRRLIGR